MARNPDNHKAVNVATARVIPLVLAGIVGYVTWVVVVLVCVKCLLKPPASLHAPRHGAAIAVLVIYFILLFFMAVTYLRLLYTVLTNPGFLPRGPEWHAQNKNKTKHGRRRSEKSHGAPDSSGSDEKANSVGGNGLVGYAYAGPSATSGPMPNEAVPGLQNFFKRDVYVCQGDGRPLWCTKCLNWKPDRAHHCREVDRCVRKMDHFCPWVGGMVSETTFKFFIQFVTWTALYCTFVLILMAILLAEYHKKTGTAKVHWVITIGFAAMFGLITYGMSGSALQFAIVNTTSVENLSRKSIVWQLAVHISRPLTQLPTFSTISFSTAQTPPTSDASQQEPPPKSIKTFAILHSKPGENPWDLGPYGNFKSVMGEHWYDWFLPLKHSPCCNHDKYEGQFAMGQVLKRMKMEAGIPEAGDEALEKHRRRRRRRPHREREKLGSDEVIAEKQRRRQGEADR